MKELLIKQINFEHWANTELLAAMRQAEPLSERASLLFSHIISVGSRWIKMVKGEPVTISPFEERTPDENQTLLDIPKLDSFTK